MTNKWLSRSTATETNWTSQGIYRFKFKRINMGGWNRRRWSEKRESSGMCCRKLLSRTRKVLRRWLCKRWRGYLLFRSLSLIPADSTRKWSYYRWMTTLRNCIKWNNFKFSSRVPRSTTSTSNWSTWRHMLKSGAGTVITRLEARITHHKQDILARRKPWWKPANWNDLLLVHKAQNGSWIIPW